MSYRKSPLKWAGSKLALIERLLGHIGKPVNYVEPFMGSGVVAMNVDFQKATLSDTNAAVVDLVNAIKNDPVEVIEELRRLFSNGNNADRYEERRSAFNRSTSEHERAILAMYLNRHCFNGLWRENKYGKFNTPFGRYGKIELPEERIIEMSWRLRSADIVCKDFREVMQDAPRGSVIYCDPPYIPASKSSNFTGYGAGGFSIRDQQELAGMAEYCSRTYGCKVIISNSFTEESERIYGNGKCESFIVKRSIAASTTARKVVRELISVYEK